MKKLYQTLPTALFALTLLALADAYVMWRYEREALVWLWLIGVLGVSFVRLLDWKFWRRPHLFFVLALLDGALFGSLFWFVEPKEPMGIFFALFILAGVSAGATATLAYKAKFFSYFLFALLAPTILWLVKEGSLYTLIALALMLYYFLMLHLARQNYERYQELIELEKSLEEKNRKIAHQSQWIEHFAHLPLGIFSYDKTFRIKECNDHLPKMLSVTKDELLRLDLSKLSDRRVISALKRACEGESGRYEGEYVTHLSKKQLFIDLYTAPIKSGSIQECLGIVFDISDLVKTQRKLQKLAYYDPVTGLYNRAYFFSHLEQLLSQSSYLILIDIDSFREINDTFGHDVGDEVLRVFAKRLQKLCKKAQIARIGGDEFVVVIDDEKLLTHQERIQQELAKEIKLQNLSLRIQTTCVVMKIDEDFRSALDVMKRIDMLMHLAKEHGQNILFYNEEFAQQITMKEEIAKDLRSSIKEDRFEIYVQPQFDRKMQIVGAEVLLRWRHKGSYVSPELFLRIAKEIGIMPDITKIVIQKTFQLLERTSIDLSINITPYDLQKHFIERFAILAPYKERIILELTEQSFVSSEAKEVLGALQRRFGFRISIDDFGTGYANLRHLLDLSIDEIKIDKSFILPMLEDPKSRKIVSTIAKMAKGMGLEVVAEGVEQEEHLRFLQDLPIDRYQGYLLARPMRVEEFLKGELQ